MTKNKTKLIMVRHVCRNMSFKKPVDVHLYFLGDFWAWQSAVLKTFSLHIFSFFSKIHSTDLHFHHNWALHKFGNSFVDTSPFLINLFSSN